MTHTRHTIATSIVDSPKRGHRQISQILAKKEDPFKRDAITPINITDLLKPHA